MPLDLKGLPKNIFMEKYAYPGETSWKERARMVAKTISSAEKPEDRDFWDKKFYQSINEGDFCPGGRILFGAGRTEYNMLNCYVLEPEDSRESIAKILSDTYLISCAGGGIGYNFSNIRPRGSNIQNIPNSHPGAIHLMEMINKIGDHVKAGGNRRTALMAILDVTHPDLLEFLDVKLNQEKLNNFNISVGITNKFIEAVENNDEWYFTFGGRHNKYYVYEVDRKSELGDDKIKIVAPSEEEAIKIALVHHQKHYQDSFSNAIKKSIKAKDLWDRIIDNAIECGEPGVFNKDFANEYTNVSYFEELPATNPCGEEVLPAYGNCCLGHVNLSNMVVEGEVDWKRLAKTVRLGVRFLDNVLAVNYFPIPECRDVAFRSRRIGLGVTGLHYFLIKLGYVYGSESCLEFLERLFATIRNEAYKASCSLAKEKGSFEAYNWAKLKKEKYFKTLPSRIRAEIRQHGLRNAALLTVAPTGTISMVLGVSTGIEPIFSPVYKRRWKTASEGVWNESYVVDNLFKKLYTSGEDVSHVVGAYEVTPEEHIKVQAVVQSYIDSALSKTCNLPENYKITSETKKTLTQYAPEIKGFTFYKSGSRGNEPLTSVDWKTIDLKELIVGNTHENGSDVVNSCKSGVCEL